MASIPHDYEERVYAGVLGKIIGVYLGRPFEGWTYERIAAELGEIDYYVHERLGKPLIVTDDDISGAFTFLRALPDHGYDRSLTPAQIGDTWLNYIVENRTILWWGGLGTSTEHTAYLRLKSGVQAPESGSIALNSKIVAEQIGAQIFIDGWAMVAPGDPELAADLARRAASVSHDGEAIHGAQVVAALEAQAFVERDLNALLDTAVGLIPSDSVIYRMIGDIREWHAAEPDWRRTRERIAMRYGYDKYRGACHMVPNHALIIHALLHGDDNFQRSLMIVNTCGWDTDCNSGNVGCILGIKNGLAGIEAGPDYRGPVADRMYLATADGGRAVTDALTETYHVVNAGRALAGLEPTSPKADARFHFSLPGSVQGFLADEPGTTVENVEGHSERGERSLAIRYRGGKPARAHTATFIPPEAIDTPGYALVASPTLYPGQLLTAGLEADEGNDGAVACRLYLCSYNGEDRLDIRHGPEAILQPGARQQFEWRVPDTDGQPIARVGVEVSARSAGSVYLDDLSWEGSPDTTLGQPGAGGTMWRRAWVDGVDHFERGQADAYHLTQDEGTGLIIQGTRAWTDYRVSATITPLNDHDPLKRLTAGLCARVQGMRRYYALTLAGGGGARLLRALSGTTVLAEADFPWQYEGRYELALEVQGARIQGWIDGELLFDVEDSALDGGGVALLVQGGSSGVGPVRVRGLA